MVSFENYLVKSFMRHRPQAGGNRGDASGSDDFEIRFVGAAQGADPVFWNV
jgi:hypothetical protein